MNEPDFASRVMVCLLGGAIGHAFGYEIEFDSLACIRQRFGPQGLTEPVRHGGKLITSDDTQMTLFTLEGLLRAPATGLTPCYPSLNSYKTICPTESR